MENLTDRQAADAVRSRLDWKYALSLELTDPGFDHTVLSEFRTRLVAQTAEERFKGFIEKYPLIVQRVPQYALASYLGMTTEFLSRIRNKRTHKKS